jgi:hypothetical protein
MQRLRNGQQPLMGRLSRSTQFSTDIQIGDGDDRAADVHGHG